MSSLLAGKAPLNGNPMTVHTTTSSLSFSPQRGTISDPSPTQTLLGEQADGDLRLVQPVAMFGGVVNRESIPQPSLPLSRRTVPPPPCGYASSDCPAPSKWCQLRIADGKFQQAVGKQGRRTAEAEPFQSSDDLHHESRGRETRLKPHTRSFLLVELRMDQSLGFQVQACV